VTRGQRLTAAIALAAAILLLGRASALLFVNREWYASLGASSVWRDRVATTTVMYVVGFVVALLFAWANVAAVRRSVLALVVPKRLGNVEFGEEVPSRRLWLATIGVSAAAAALSLFALPDWVIPALARAHVVFAESDPYFGLDLSHFVAWLPFEESLYHWCIALFAIVALLVIVMYALTPSLRWSRGSIRITAYARRHMSVLGALLLLLAAWGFRLDAFTTLVDGSGPGGALTRIDRVWIVPADVALSLVSIGAAVVLLAAGWVGQTVTAFITVTVIVAATVATQLLAPIAAAQIAASPGSAAAEAPYAETRADYTARAFQAEARLPAVQYAADSTLLSHAGALSVAGALPDVVFPGAIGTVVVQDPARVIAAPRIGTGVARLLRAWAEQNPRMLADAIPGSAAFVRVRDVRDRVRALAPIFSQSRAIGAIPTARGILWIVDLFVTSEWYPLAAARPADGERITYYHHAGTAYVSGGTGVTAIVPDSALDPVARAWFASHPGGYVAPAVPASMLEQPHPATPAAAPPTPAATETAFRRAVERAYTRMRAALDSGNLRAFGAAFDSLGIIVRGHP
jgi:uncharacterized membrane protein (UPF0182 family)